MRRCPRASVASSVTELSVGCLWRGKQIGAAMLLAVVHQQGLKQPCGLYAPEMRILPIVLIMHLKTKKSQSKYALRFGVLLVEMMGIEPTTSTLRTLRSPN